MTISASAGYILATGELSAAMILPVLGVFFLSWGSAALNQYQERQPDSIMSRTMNRPLPKHYISPETGLTLAVSSAAIGAFMLILMANMTAFLLGLLALFWYNAVYTPLKKVTALAVFPGALIGAIPPAIGWVSGGGSIAAPQVLALSLFFFIWQIPHFWLLVLIYEDDYRQADFPVLTDIFDRWQLTRLTYIWIIALAVSCLLIPLFGRDSSIFIDLLLIASGVVLIWRSRHLLRQYYNIKTFKLAFMQVNLYVLTVILFLSAGKLIF